MPIQSTRFSELAAALAPGKDVDGVHPLHLGRFLTNKRVWRQPRGADIVQLLKRAGMTPAWGRMSSASGMPLGWQVSWRGSACTRMPLYRPGEAPPPGPSTCYSTVTCSSSIPTICPPMDGVALKPGVIVVDARSRPDGWLPHQPEGLPQAVALLIPVPGGIGPTTPAMRLASLVAMYRAPAIVSLDS